MEALISNAEFQHLLKKNEPFTKDEMFRMASWSKTLISQYDNLTSAEKDSVRWLEGKNLYRYLKSCIVGIGDKKGLDILQSKHASRLYLEVIKEITDNNHEPHLFGVMVTTYLLSNCDNENPGAKFEGIVPKKLFSFRQTIAEDWFSSVVAAYALPACRIAVQNSFDDALLFLFMQCAWHMHHSDPQAYPLNNASVDELIELHQKFVSRFK